MVFYAVTLDVKQWNVEAKNFAEAAYKVIAQFGADKVTLVAFCEEQEE